MACSPQPYQLVIVVVKMPPLRLRIRVALLRRDAALRVIPRVHAHRYSGVADQSALQVSPLLILAAVADLHQQRRALGVHRQGQTEIVVLDQAVLREAPLLRNVYTDVLYLCRIYISTFVYREFKLLLLLPTRSPGCRRCCDRDRDPRFRREGGPCCLGRPCLASRNHLDHPRS